MSELLGRLRGGDRRSIGRSGEVVEAVRRDLSLFGAVFRGVYSDDPLVRMRAADVCEKVSAQHPEVLGPFKQELLGRVASIDQQEVRWHVAQMLPRLTLDAEDPARAMQILIGYLEDRSKIVKTNSMQALADLVVDDGALRPRVAVLLRELMAVGSPAVRIRGKRLLASLEE